VAAGSTQSTATGLTSQVNLVITATTGQGVIAASSPYCEVLNASAVDLLFYPPSGAQIYTYGVNVPVTVKSGGSATLVMNSATQAYVF
jgi:hypothetical protein